MTRNSLFAVLLLAASAGTSQPVSTIPLVATAGHKLSFMLGDQNGKEIGEIQRASFGVPLATRGKSIYSAQQKTLHPTLAFWPGKAADYLYDWFAHPDQQRDITITVLLDGKPACFYQLVRCKPDEWYLDENYERRPEAPVMESVQMNCVQILRVPTNKPEKP